MYYYVYDSFVAGQKYERVLGRIETQANNLGLTGERGQVSSIRKVEDVVREALQRGYAPIVIVGNDQTFNAAINTAAKLNASIPLAYVPLDERTPIADLLGVTTTEAIVTLSRRIVRPLPVAFANKHCFVSTLTCRAIRDDKRGSPLRQLLRAELPVFEPTVSIDGAMRVRARAQELTITHDPSESRLRLTLSRQPGRILRRSDRGERSAFWGKHIEITAAHPIACYVDGRPIVRTPIIVESSQQTVPVVVGRGRILP